MQAMPHELVLYYFKHREDIILINISTNDFLCAYLKVELFYEFWDFMKKFIDVTTQEGCILKYLNLHTVQSSYEISLDQSEHILDTISNPWLKEPSELVKGLHAP